MEEAVGEGAFSEDEGQFIVIGSKIRRQIIKNTELELKSGTKYDLEKEEGKDQAMQGRKRHN